MSQRRRYRKSSRRHSLRSNRRPKNLWRETEDGRSALTERVDKGEDNDRKSKTMAEVLGFNPDRMW